MVTSANDRPPNQTNDLGRTTQFWSAVADRSKVNNHNRSKRGWSPAVAVISVLVLFLAACGGVTELSTTDPGVETSGQAPDGSSIPGTGDNEQSVVAGDGSDVAEQAPITEMSLDASPADRQSRQAAGAPTIRTDASTAPTQAGAQIATQDEIDAARSAAKAAQAQAAQSQGAVERQPSTPPGVAQRDVPLPQGDRVQTAPAVSSFSPRANRSVAELDERVQQEIFAPEVLCQPGIDAACTDVQERPVDAEPASSDRATGATNPTGPGALIEAAPAAPPPADNDSACPAGAGASCGSADVAPVVTDIPADADTADADSATEVVEANCEVRFWDRGCVATPDDEFDVADYFERDEADDTDQVPDEAEGAGVDVPQDVIDVLLTPPSGSAEEADTPGDRPTDTRAPRTATATENHPTAKPSTARSVPVVGESEG